MLNTLFIQEVQKYWQLNNVRIALSMPKSSEEKIRHVISTLKNVSIELKQPEQFLVSTYAFFYADTFRSKSFNLVQLKLNEFLQKVQLEQLPKFSGDDTELAYKLRTVWSRMNHMKSVDIPFKVRSVLSKKRVTIGVNTFFKKSFDFIKFTQIGHFINQNKLNYPEMHSIAELFIHIPAIYGPREYYLAQYTDPTRTLEQYYKNVYKRDIPKEQRYSKLLESTPSSQIEHLKHGLWCSGEVKRQFVEVVK